MPLPTAPIVELMSLRPGDGKTQFLYHLIATSILPECHGGKEAAVIVFDTDSRFSVPRLAGQVQRLAIAHSQELLSNDRAFRDMLEYTLRHVHIFTPHSLASTIATIHALPQYLFDPSGHHSFDRPISFIALDSASAFYWQARAEAEEASLLKSKHPSATTLPPQPANYTQLAGELKNVSRILFAPIMFTCWDASPHIKDTSAFTPDAHSIRPSLPPPWQSVPTLRLVVQRAPIRKLPADLNFEEVQRESEMQRRVIEKGKFEIFVNEWNLEERSLQRLREKGAMFDFFITDEGVKVGDGPE